MKKLKSITVRTTGPVLYCGDPHGEFGHIIEAALRTEASAVVLLGDMAAQRPLEVELAPIRRLLWWIPGNHDSDSAMFSEHTWGSQLADRNVHCRVVELPHGTRLAGLGGVFRESVWHPDKPFEPRFNSRREHSRATPRQDRWRDGPPRKHASTIYPAEFSDLAKQRADVLITHEAPGYHPHGTQLLDTVAHMLGVTVVVHGHHHDCRDSSSQWVQQGFKSFGVALRGITAISRDGVATIVEPGEPAPAFDH